MKFKTIFALFNAVLAFSFVFVFLMPFMLLGSAYSLDFWKANWPLAVFFLAVLAAFNAFFIANWKTFRLVEKEDWAALMAWLRKSAFEKGRFGRRPVRLYVNAALLTADDAAIRWLEGELDEKKPSALRRDALLFSVARSLKADYPAAEAFMARFADGRGVDNAAWLGFYRAFNLVAQRKGAECAAALRELMASKEAVLALLAAHVAASSVAPALPPQERSSMSALAEGVRKSLRSRYKPLRWSALSEKAKAEVHVVVLSKLLDGAGAWLYAQEGA